MLNVNLMCAVTRPRCIYLCYVMPAYSRLVILDGTTGEVKSTNGRGDVSKFKTDPMACLAQWKANAVMSEADMAGSWCTIL